MMVFLYVVFAILGISSIITFLIVFLINKSSNKDDYDEVQFAKTKKFNPNEFDDEEESFDADAEIISDNLEMISENNEDVSIEEVKSEAELDKVDFLENTQTKLKVVDSDIKNKFDAVILAIGAWKAKQMQCIGEENFYDGIKFLRDIKLRIR